MRLSQTEKMEIIRIVEQSEVGVVRTLKELGIHPSTFYNWYAKYRDQGYDGLLPAKRQRRRFWNQVPPWEVERVVQVALDRPELSPRELAYLIIEKHRYFISESTVYRILKSRALITSPAYMVIRASDSFKKKTSVVNQMWQTDFTYLKVVGWGWYYLSTIMDDYSRYIIYWELCKSMKDVDVERCVEQALNRANLVPDQRPKLLSDNGPCYKSTELKDFLDAKGIQHINGSPYHPQTQGKIERYHRSMKNIIKLDNYYIPEELERRLMEFVDYYNNHRYHESLKNLKPVGVYLGRGEKILQENQNIKRKTMHARRRYYQKTLTFNQQTVS